MWVWGKYSHDGFSVVPVGAVVTGRRNITVYSTVYEVNT